MGTLKRRERGKVEVLDRRICKRAQISGLPQIEISSNNILFPGRLLDISPKGACIQLSKSFLIRSFISINFPPENGHPAFSLTARVLWRHERSGRLIQNHSQINLNGHCHLHGILFFQSPPESSKWIEKIEGYSKKVAERRIEKRRNRLLSKFKLEKRSFERRDSKNFLLKSNRLSHSFDKWTTLHTYLRPLTSIDYPYVWVDGKKVIMLGSNSFLGLSTDPRVKEAAIKAIEKFGTGSGGPPVLNGTSILHDELCEEIAKFKGTETAVLFPSGYLANYACLSTLFSSPDDVLFNDERNHASLIDGCRKSKAKVRFFKHTQLNDLANKLRQYPIGQNKVIIVDGVSSMDGDLCNLPELYNLAQKYNAMLMVDDAHATGVVGKTGRGTAEHFNMMGKADLTTVTLSKSLGCVGGAICGSNALIKILIHLSRPFIFSASLPPSVCASALAALKIVREEPELIAKLKENVRFLVEGLTGLGFEVRKTDSAIIPVIIGDEIKTYRLAYLLGELGVFVNAVSRPAVPRELSRLRLSTTAKHEKDDLEKALKAFEIAGKKLKLI